MQISGALALVTGAASGLGRATAAALVERGAIVLLADANAEAGAAAAASIGAHFVATDVTSAASVADALAAADRLGRLRLLVHCAGGGRPVRVLNAVGEPFDLQEFRRIVDLNVVGSFDVLRQAASRMARNEPIDGDRGVCVLTSSIAAFDGQTAQVAYAASKAAIVGMTLAAARDLSHHGVRLCTIAPGMFDTGMLAGLDEGTRAQMEGAVPHPARLGRPEEFASTAVHIIENGMLNGETIRLDGGLRLSGVETMWGNRLQPS